MLLIRKCAIYQNKIFCSRHSSEVEVSCSYILMKGIKIINIKSSGDLGSVCLIKEFKKEDIQISKNLNIKVSSRYLNPFSRGYLLSDKVKVGMTEENPLLLHYSLGNKSYIQFFIAPKFDDE